MTEAFYFDTPEEAYDYLERRGYTVTKLNNWLPPKNIGNPSKKDLVAALYLEREAAYGGIVVLARCPFCGGNAPDVETWQRRTP
jgi:hypothetical protein